MRTMTKAALAVAAWLVILVPALATEGLVTLQSAGTARETIDRFEAALKAGGLSVFARIDHAANATSAGMTLRPTELIIFGNPKGGTPLMASRQTAGIDLPMKALVWEDADGKTWLAYNDPAWVAKRHDLPPETAKIVEAMSQALKTAAEKAIQR